MGLKNSDFFPTNLSLHQAQETHILFIAFKTEKLLLTGKQTHKTPGACLSLEEQVIYTSVGSGTFHTVWSLSYHEEQELKIFSWQFCRTMQDTGCLSQSNEALVHPLISGHRNISVRGTETAIRICASSVWPVSLNKNLVPGKATKIEVSCNCAKENNLINHWMERQDYNHL